MSSKLTFIILLKPKRLKSTVFVEVILAISCSKNICNFPIATVNIEPLVLPVEKFDCAYASFAIWLLGNFLKYTSNKLFSSLSVLPPKFDNILATLYILNFSNSLFKSHCTNNAKIIALIKFDAESFQNGSFAFGSKYI